MFKGLLFIIALGFTAQGHSQVESPVEGYFQLASFEVKEVESGEMSTGEFRDLCKNDRNILGQISSILAVGKEIWQIVEAGRPTLNFTTDSASAIPSKATCVSSLEYWQIPEFRTYQVRYKNLLGMEVITFSYKVIYTYGGQFEGRGQYLANVSVHPMQIDLSWGFDLNVQVKIKEALNMGSHEDPVAGLQFGVQWSAQSLNADLNEDNYLVLGSGEFIEL